MPLKKYTDPLYDEEGVRIPSPVFTAVIWILLFVICTGGCIFFLLTRPVVITSANVSDETFYDMDVVVPLSLSGAMSPGTVSFLVPEGTVSSDIVTENLYNERRFLVHINTESSSFYGRMTESGVPLDMGMISGDEGLVKSVGVTYDRSGALLIFDLSRVCECVLTLNDNKVLMEAVAPHDMYDFIVVADPGSAEAAGVSRDVSERCAKILRDKNIKVYITDERKGEEGGVSPRDLVEESGADIYIGLDVSHDGPDHHGIVTWYDPVYYIPGYGSVELSECVLRNLAISASDRAHAINAAPFGNVLYDIDVPATCATLGNADNSREMELMSEDSYRDRLAKGLSEAVLESFASMSGESE